VIAHVLESPFELHRSYPFEVKAAILYNERIGFKSFHVIGNTNVPVTGLVRWILIDDLTEADDECPSAKQSTLCADRAALLRSKSG
jgi:hypothetical protein